MSVGANSIKRAAKTANTAVEPKEESAPVKKSRIAKNSVKAARKPADKEKPAKNPKQKSENNLSEKPAGKSNYEAYGIGQQLPIHLL